MKLKGEIWREEEEGVWAEQGGFDGCHGEKGRGEISLSRLGERERRGECQLENPSSRATLDEGEEKRGAKG
jgi:hypothetical protein